jgi:HSP20 family protein
MSRQNDFLTDFVDMLGGPSLRGVLNTSGQRPLSRIPPKIPVDIVNEEKTIYIYAELPGINKENIEVDFYNNKLTVSAEKVKAYETPGISEIYYGNLERTLTLPICVTVKEAVSVSYNNGILKIKINKLLEEENRFSLRVTE